MLPALTNEELDEMARTLPVVPADDIRELLEFCSGIDGTLEEINFSGRTIRDGFEAEFIPYGLPSTNWGPIYLCCHDAPVMLLQAALPPLTAIFRPLQPVWKRISRL